SAAFEEEEGRGSQIPLPNFLNVVMERRSMSILILLDSSRNPRSQEAMNTAVAQEVFFLSQTGVGIMGNSLPNMLYFSSFLLGSKPKPTDLVIIHLAVITRTAGILGLRLLQTSAEYKSFAYVYRITRSLSICTTSFLSMLQAITISPSGINLKAQIPNVILLVLAILWIPNLLISTNLLYQVVASHNATSTESNCYVVPVRTLLQGLILILMALRDILSLGLMSCSSGYMVLLLH
uniref:Vomeronasal type-1 receptor n=1 Tax=Ornithorhynchus anatinus TaxID=9258 RepID=F6UGJ4_ORNAN